MNNEDLGPQPDPVIEDGEPNPGGADAVSGDPADEGLGRDLHPEANPAVDDVLPDEIAQADDKSQSPEGEADDQESGTQEDPDAGQEAEDGSAEPPA
ncbi:hypothetical protein [Nocardioides sp. Soil805]|uniref:hypothetical protein n=1 Tax=Nocardioides sp. Soil805 TaxID=1736416 RepID=UPI0007027EF0|nr:hypothetical protein [Nocardioides sp. Soil805]KRF36995.1 hypothetical protein ASG94_06300 [Nocardioides sp. Soil805]